MTITLELSAEEIDAFKQVTKLEGDAEAVAHAAREFLRLRRLLELKSVSGKVDLEQNWREIEELELGECSFPR